jgi:hypothetical protein
MRGEISEGGLPMGEMTREELSAMTDQELLAYEREPTREIADAIGSAGRGEQLSP